MLVVKKFGGTSVANKERIFNVAKRCIEDYKKGNHNRKKFVHVSKDCSYLSPPSMPGQSPHKPIRKAHHSS